jgi:DNA-binding NarL/FixJ family response regulator
LPADPIKVLLADDHTMFREGLAGLLASYGGMEVVNTPNGEEAVALAERMRLDVVLMQVQMGGRVPASVQAPPANLWRSVDKWSE